MPYPLSLDRTLDSVTAWRVIGTLWHHQLLPCKRSTILSSAQCSPVKCSIDQACLTVQEDGIVPISPLQQTPGYCWRTSKCRKCASHMPSLKAQEHGESKAATAALSHGNRFANSIRPFVGQEKRRKYISTSGVKKPVLKISVRLWSRFEVFRQKARTIVARHRVVQGTCKVQNRMARAKAGILPCKGGKRSGSISEPP